MPAIIASRIKPFQGGGYYPAVTLPTAAGGTTDLGPGSGAGYRYLCGEPSCPGLLGYFYGEVPERPFERDPIGVRHVRFPAVKQVGEAYDARGFRLFHPRGYVALGLDPERIRVFRVLATRPDRDTDSEGYQRKHRRPHPITGNLGVAGHQPMVGEIIECPVCRRWNRTELPPGFVTA